MPPHDTTRTSELVDLVYAATLDPQRYDELMAHWQQHLDAVLAAPGTPGTPADDENAEPCASAQGEELARHFDRAFAILERLGRQDAGTHSLAALVESESHPALLVDAQGRIAAVNARAHAQFGLASGHTLDALSLEATGLTHIRQALARLADEPPGRLLTVTRILSPRDGETPLVALNRAPAVQGQPPMALLSVADIAWSARIGELLRHVFGLTAAECEIVRGIIAGLSIEQLAAQRSRSVQTVKTQSKSVLRKLALRTQAELIRMVATLMQMDAAPESLRGPTPTADTSRTTLLRGAGRPLDVTTIGPPGGRPVLFIHGMLDGHGVTRALHEGLWRAGIRLICPARPNFGASGPDGAAQGAPERFAADLDAVLDHFGVACCPVVGHMAAAVYAFAAAARLGPRITHVVNIAGGVPIVSPAQFASMSARQRIVAYTARHAPRLLPLILRVGIAQIDGGGERAVVRALYRSAPLDHAIASTPEIFALLCEGFRFALMQGHRAFEIDAWHVVRDWSAWVRASSQPVLLVHGRQDPVVDVATVRAFADGLGARARLIERPDQGQLLFYAAPEVVLQALGEVLAEAPAPR